jgi:uncharacterized protein YegL
MRGFPMTITHTIKKRYEKRLESKPSRIKEFEKLVIEQNRKNIISTSGQSVAIRPFIGNICGNSTNFKIFNRQTKSIGGKIWLLVDCSGSIRGHDGELNSFCHDIMAAMEKSNTAQIEIVAFSCHPKKPISVLDYISTKEDCARIHHDETDYHDNLGQVLEIIKPKLTSTEHKQAVFIISDGYPECEDGKGRKIPQSDLIKNLKRQVVQLENQKVKFFAIMLNRYSPQEVQNIFRKNSYTTTDLNEGTNKLVIRINDFLKSLK